MQTVFHVCKDGSVTNIEAIWAPHEREDFFATLTIHVVPKEHLAKKKRRNRAEKKVVLSQDTMRDAITGLLKLVADTTAALLTTKRHSEIESKEDRLEIIIHGRLNKLITEKLRSVGFENRLRANLRM